jgi:diacylglycerol kinase
MASLHSREMAVFFLQISISIFLAILFLQSAIDKILDRRGNLEWLTSHFAKSPLAGFVPLLLLMLTLLELTAGLLSGVGAGQLLLSKNSLLAFLGACLAVIALLCLFLGQRMAKDYPGAASLVPYLLAAMVAVFLLA